MNVSQPDDHEFSHEAITIRVTSHLYTAMSVNTGVDSITKLLVSRATKKPVSCTDLVSHANMPVVGIVKFPRSSREEKKRGGSLCKVDKTRL